MLDRNNISGRVITPVVKRANELRAQRDQPPVMIAVTPHTFRRTYITFMLAAGFHVPYVQDQVGHTDPITTLAVAELQAHWRGPERFEREGLGR